MSIDTVAFGAADVSNCDREQIHNPGSIQPHGCLLAFRSEDLVITHAAGAGLALLGAPPPALLGSRLGDHFGQEPALALKAAAEMATAGRRLVSIHPTGTTAAYDRDVLVHETDGLLVLELEPDLGGVAGDTFSLVQDMVARIQRFDSVSGFCRGLVDCVSDLSGFDRVMVYRFLSDGSGSVEAEAHADGMEPYLGLRYPASDIPAQARDLYLRNTLRLIPDSTYSPAPIHAASGKDGPLDLSHSVLRSVSPLHLEYLANMGVAASMSISIVVERRLWGLIACHHRQPRLLPSRLRVALDLFGQMASFQLETRLGAEALADRRGRTSIHESLIAELAGQPDMAAGFQGLSKRLIDYVPSSGLALLIDGAFSSVGQTPAEGEVRRLVDWLNRSVRDGVFHTDRLTDHYPAAAGFARVGSGILALSVSRTPRDYLIWFRPEQVRQVRWAGDPNKPVDIATGRLSPRKSFNDWLQQVERQSEPWSALDIHTVEALRVSLLEVVLTHVDQLARERERARVQQQALLVELDDRIAQWELTAEQLKVESDRRTVLETELSQVLRRTVLEQESERQRIARELHDSLGQYLTAMQLDLDSITRDASVSESIRTRIDRLKGLTADAGHEVNHLAWEIRPTALDDMGLQRALEQFLEEWSERSPLQFDLHLTLEDRRLSLAIETTLYRAAQEAVRNIIKHAEATRAGVILEASDSEVRLIVEDDGKGFAVEERAPKAGESERLGLLGVRERLALIGGSLEIETSPGQGTTLIIHVPL